MKRIKVLLKDGTEEKLTIQNQINREDVIGIVLRSGKIVSLNLYYVPRFSESPFQEKHLDYLELLKKHINNHGRLDRNEFLEDLRKFKFNSSGIENTRLIFKTGITTSLNLLSGVEYLPSIFELEEAMTELVRINSVRRWLNLKTIFSCFSRHNKQYHWWFWSSTLDSSQTIYIWSSYRGIGWSYYSWGGGLILPFINKDLL